MGWMNQTLGDVFPGYKKTAEEIKLEAETIHAALDAQMDALTLKVNAVTGALDATATLISALESAGIYVNLMEPQAVGYLSRLTAQSGDPDAPPDSAYSAGLVLVIHAPDYATVLEKYQNLVKILTTWSPAP